MVKRWVCNSMARGRDGSCLGSSGVVMVVARTIAWQRGAAMMGVVGMAAVVVAGFCFFPFFFWLNLCCILLSLDCGSGLDEGCM